MLAAFFRRHSIHLLLLSVAILVVLGIVMLFSTSAFAQEVHGEIYYFVKRQVLWLSIGLCCCVIAIHIDYQFWQRMQWIGLVVSIFLLTLCFIPPIGLNVNGANRWICLKWVNFQPSELAKFTSVIFLASWLGERDLQTAEGWRASCWWRRLGLWSVRIFKIFLLPIIILSVPLFLIVREVDLGATALISGTLLAMLFVAGLPYQCLLVGILGGVSAVLWMAFQIQERAARLVAFLDPEKYKLGEGLQQWQALLAFGSGGITGLGLGDGRQKMFYLPEAHTDFIFPMMGEELGLKVTLLVVSAYFMICLCGYFIALNAKDRFGVLLGFGMTTLISLQAVINIGVTTSLLPNKGMPLPFVSFGGSNLLICLFMVGILINIHRNGHRVNISTNTLSWVTKVTPRI